MVQLKTYSQVKNFVKRMSKRYNMHHYDGCGCCWSSTLVQLDVSRMRVVLSTVREVQGAYSSQNKVIAIIKRDVRANYSIGDDQH